MPVFFDFFKKKVTQKTIKIDEKDHISANIHYVKIKNIYEPWILIDSTNLVDLKQDSKIVVQILAGGKKIEYAGIGLIDEIREIDTIQRNVSSNTNIKLIRKTYINRYYKIELVPVKTTIFFERSTNKTVYKDEKMVIYLRPNLEYHIKPAKPYVNFDVYNSSLKEMSDMRAVVSLPLEVETWFKPEIKTLKSITELYRSISVLDKINFISKK